METKNSSKAPENLEIYEAEKQYKIALYKTAEKAALLIQETFDKDYNNIGMNRVKVEAAIKFLAIVEKGFILSE